MKRIFFKTKNFRVLQCVNGIAGRGLGQEAVHIAYPPVFYGKLYDVILAFLINAVGAQAAFVYKKFIAADVAFLQQVLFFLQPLYPDDGSKIEFFIRRKGDEAGNIFQDAVIHNSKIKIKNQKLSHKSLLPS